MMSLSEIFKPQKITLSGKTTILDTDSGKIVIKEDHNNVAKLFNYLDGRGFNAHPNLLDKYDNANVYEYVNDSNIPVNQKSSDMASLLATLHYKTTYYEPVLKDNIKEIYENILTNINYLDNYFNRIFKVAIEEEYMRPSYYLLVRNETKITALFKYLKEELEKWFNNVIDMDRFRVACCHNNPSLDHFIDGERASFISWDNYRMDTPVLDIIKIYKNDFNKYDFESFLNTYLKANYLQPEEKRLLFINLAIPKCIYFNDDEMNNTIMVGKFIDYISKTENIIKNYYPIEESI